MVSFKNLINSNLIVADSSSVATLSVPAVDSQHIFDLVAGGHYTPHQIPVLYVPKSYTLYARYPSIRLIQDEIKTRST